MSNAAREMEVRLLGRISELEREIRRLKCELSFSEHLGVKPMAPECYRDPRTGEAREISLPDWRGEKGRRRRAIA